MQFRKPRRRIRHGRGKGRKGQNVRVGHGLRRELRKRGELLRRESGGHGNARLQSRRYGYARIGNGRVCIAGRKARRLSRRLEKRPERVSRTGLAGGVSMKSFGMKIILAFLLTAMLVWQAPPVRISALEKAKPSYSASATSETEGHGAENAADGNTETYWEADQKRRPSRPRLRSRRASRRNGL